MVGQRIKTYLEENGIKKNFVAEKASIPNALLTAILAGTRKIEVMEYYRICTALKVDLMTFLTDEETEV